MLQQLFLLQFVKVRFLHNLKKSNYSVLTLAFMHLDVHMQPGPPHYLPTEGVSQDNIVSVSPGAWTPAVTSFGTLDWMSPTATRKRSAASSIDSFVSEAASSPVVSEEADKKPHVRSRTTFSQKQVAVLERGESEEI